MKIKRPTDAHEETNRHSGFVKEDSEKDSPAKMEDFTGNVTMFSVLELRRSLFHPLATVRHRT
jgi:hypothetical protein